MEGKEEEDFSISWSLEEALLPHLHHHLYLRFLGWYELYEVLDVNLGLVKKSEEIS